MQRECPSQHGHEALAQCPIANSQRKKEMQRERERERDSVHTWKAHTGNAAFAPLGSMQNSHRFY